MIPLKEIEPLWESEAKATLSPMSRAVSPIPSTLWKTRQPERMRCPLFNKGHLRIQCTAHHIITGQSKSSQLRRESVCKLCCLGIARIRYRGNLKRSRWTGRWRRCSGIRRGRIRWIWDGTMNSWKKDWHSISKWSTRSYKRKWKWLKLSSRR